MKILPLLLIILSMLSTITRAADLPLTGDIQGVHDPVIIKCGARYYLFSTGAGIPIRVSEDKIEWRRGGRLSMGAIEWNGFVG